MMENLLQMGVDLNVTLFIVMPTLQLFFAKII